MSAIIEKVSDEETITPVHAVTDIYDTNSHAPAISAFLTEPMASDEYLIVNAQLQLHGQGWVTVAIRRFVEGVDSVEIIEPNGYHSIEPTGSQEALNEINARMSRLFGGTAAELPGSSHRS